MLMVGLSSGAVVKLETPPAPAWPQDDPPPAPPRRFDVVLAGSWQNGGAVRALAQQIRAKIPDWTVFDFTDRTCRADPAAPAQIVPPPFNPEAETYAEHIASLPPPLRGRIAENQAIYGSARVAVLILPAGEDAALDFGYALGRGAVGFVIGKPRGGRTANHLWANMVVDRPEELLCLLQQFALGNDYVPPLNVLRDCVKRNQQQGQDF
jgi:hypothetical protein